MKIDLAGPERRGLAMGLNEAAGYLAVAATAMATGYLAAEYGLRPAPFVLGAAYAALGLGLSTLVVRETRGHALSSVSQAGLVNNLNDGLAWGLFPILFATHGLTLGQIGMLTALLPAAWGAAQLVTGAASDRYGRKPFIVCGMLLQAAALCLGTAGTISRSGPWRWPCSERAPPWSTPPCWRRSATSPTPAGGPAPSASTGSGAKAVSRPRRLSPGASGAGRWSIRCCR